jgi:hypothetical protein
MTQISSAYENIDENLRSIEVDLSLQITEEDKRPLQVEKDNSKDLHEKHIEVIKPNIEDLSEPVFASDQREQFIQAGGQLDAKHDSANGIFAHHSLLDR